MQQPIPAPHPDDDEDVSWALSTASALWSRGEVAESLKWLRRAAETASDANRDLRSLELFKIAAEVATMTDIARNSAAPPPTPSQAPPSAQPISNQYPSNQPPNGQAPASKRPPGPPPRRSGAPGPAAPPTPRTSPLPPPVATPRPSGPPPLMPRASAPPGAPQTPRPSGLPPQGRVAQPPPPARSSAGSNVGTKAPVVAEGSRVALRRGGPAAVAGTRSQRRETATGAKGRPQAATAAASTRGASAANPSASSKDPRRAFAEELTSERSTFAGLGTEPRTGDDATTSPNIQRAPLPIDAGATAQRESERSVTKPKREEEITVQRTFFADQAPYESARLKPGFDDLDEKTNVATDAPPGEGAGESERPRPPERSSERPPSSERTLTGMPAPRDVPQSFRPPPSAAPLADRAHARSTDETHPRSDRIDDAEDTDLRKTNAQPAASTEGVTSFKVAVFAEASRGVQLVLLRPFEPTAEGLVTAFIVPTDQASSDAIAALLRRGNKS